jgi:hypothetical protein
METADALPELGGGGVLLGFALLVKPVKLCPTINEIGTN